LRVASSGQLRTGRIVECLDRWDEKPERVYLLRVTVRVLGFVMVVFFVRVVVSVSCSLKGQHPTNRPCERTIFVLTLVFVVTTHDVGHAVFHTM
jgi:hypothetical protein